MALIFLQLREDRVLAGQRYSKTRFTELARLHVLQQVADGASTLHPQWGAPDATRHDCCIASYVSNAAFRRAQVGSNHSRAGCPSNRG